METQPLLTAISIEDSMRLHQLLKAVGWNFTPGQVKSSLSFGKKFGHRVDQRLVSSAALYEYGPAFSSIGVVTVDPEFQRRGLGRAVVEKCLQEAAKPDSAISLVATAAGFPLYNALGFETVEYIHRLEHPGSFVDSKVGYDSVRPFQTVDLPSVIRLDETVMGANRTDMYRVLVEDMSEGYVVREENSDIIGWGMAVERIGRINTGPLMARDAEIALRIVQKFLREPRRRVRLDVPGEQADFLSGLVQLGFKEVLVSPVMVRGGHALPGQRSHLYGIADPAFG